jgi:hypothetical protein
MRSLVSLAAICGTFLTLGQASATSFDPLSVNGTFTDQFKDPFVLSGSLIVDASSGLIAGGSLKLAGEAWTQVVSQGSAGGFYDVSIQSSIFNSGYSSSNCGPGCHDILQLVLAENPLALLQNGGSIVSGLAYLRDAGFSITSVNGTVSATPIPPTLPLFVAGLGALVLVGWHSTRATKTSATAS